ncbi:hypothetical protein [Stenotrophomonas lactitubi]|uniref:hypothetical protein n=1 Tax=Stenotrophomonas lactitubi TaxID=2045214 RepID=UPI003207F9E7
MKDAFIGAVRDRKKVRLTFFSKQDGRELTRLCAPMDFGPSSRASDKSDRFHLWDYESDAVMHTLSVLPAQVKCIELVDEQFDPGEFVTWPPKWIVERDWGKYS